MYQALWQLSLAAQNYLGLSQTQARHLILEKAQSSQNLEPVVALMSRIPNLLREYFWQKPLTFQFINS